MVKELQHLQRLDVVFTNFASNRLRWQRKTRDGTTDHQSDWVNMHVCCSFAQHLNDIRAEKEVFIYKIQLC